jgi:hypothetical protein
MRVVLIGLVLAGGCIIDQKQEPTKDPAPVVQPRTCVSEITLDGSSSAVPIGPMTIDSNGASVCLHLDATHILSVAHFGANTDYVAGSTSPFVGVLQDSSGTTLQDGWDVTVSNMAPMTMMNLEWNAPAHEVTDAILWIHTQAQQATMTVNVSLLEPLE